MQLRYFPGEDEAEYELELWEAAELFGELLEHDCSFEVFAELDPCDGVSDPWAFEKKGGE